MGKRLTDMLRELTDQRDDWERRELPNLPTGEIDISAWVKITGIGLGSYGQYLISERGVSFKGWTTDQIAEAPAWQQPDMLAENEHRLSFPCTPQEFLDFVRDDVSGCLAQLEQLADALISTKPDITEERIKVILAACGRLGYDPLSIPYAGKIAIKNICLDTPGLYFTEETFKKAYSKASTTKRIRHSGREKYTGRGK